MTKFQNVSGHDIHIFEKDGSVKAIIKKMAIMEGKRIDEYTIYTEDFGPLITKDKFTHRISVREVNSILDGLWRIRVSQKTVAIPNSFMIPSGEIVTIIERVRAIAQNEDWYLLLYHDEYTSIPVSACDSELIPVSRPLMIRVLHPEGVSIQEDKEPLSACIAHAPMESVLVVDYKTFSSLPSKYQLPRWRLWQNKGWITFDSLRMEIIGYATPSIERRFLRFFKTLRPLHEKSQTPIGGNCCICMEKPVTIAFVHEEHAHGACCQECATKWSRDHDSCPICRLPVKNTIHFHIHPTPVESRSSNESELHRPSSSSNESSPLTEQMNRWLSQFVRNRQSSSTSSPGTDEEVTADIHVYMNVDPRSVDSSPSPNQGLTLEEINQACVLQMTHNADVSCTVCQNLVEQGTISQRIQRCEHVFHPLCIQQWLSINQSCPVCRSPVLDRS